MNITARICDAARQIGFDVVGVAPAYPVPGLDAYRRWIAQGYHGEMAYLSRSDRVERRADPGKIVPGVRTIVCVGMNYYTGPSPVWEGDRPTGCGWISNYAWGEDYHIVMLPRLETLAAFIRERVQPEDVPLVSTRAYVDTGPVLERGYAARAGLGFIGKHTGLIAPRIGPWVFLGEILVAAPLPPTDPVSFRCGSCRRCLDACPTGALVAPYTVDARRCISYLTIEHKGTIPPELRPAMGQWIYGCDLCYAVCPWGWGQGQGRFVRPSASARPFQASSPERVAPSLVEIMALDEAGFRAWSAGSPIARIGRTRFLRNVAVALGNWGHEQAVPALRVAMGLESGSGSPDFDPLVRAHAAWALGRIGSKDARQALLRAKRREEHPQVIREITAALS